MMFGFSTVCSATADQTVKLHFQKSKMSAGDHLGYNTKMAIAFQATDAMFGSAVKLYYTVGDNDLLQ